MSGAPPTLDTVDKWLYFYAFVTVPLLLPLFLFAKVFPDGELKGGFVNNLVEENRGVYEAGSFILVVY